MVNDKKIKVLKEYFIRKGEVDKNQLTTIGEHKTAVASLPLFKSVKNLINHKITESAKNSLKAKADKSGISLYTLKEVYRRGVCDWNANMTKTAQQCGFDRVNSFIAKGRTYFNEDYDLVEQLNRKTLSPEELAKKHNLSLRKIQAEIAKGEKIEMEHTKNIETANQIARDHIKENPKYYEALKKMEKKFVKEDAPTMSVGGGAIRGVGYVSGIPNGTNVNYQMNNIASADTVNDLLKKIIKSYHNNLHKNEKGHHKND